MEAIGTSANVTWETCSFINLAPSPYSLIDVDVFVVFLTRANCHVAFANYKWALAIAIDIWFLSALCRTIIISWLDNTYREAWRMCKLR